MLRDPYVMINFLLVAMCTIFICLPFTPGMICMNRMRRLGYDWVTLTDATRVAWCLGLRIFEIPPASDVETVPGVSRDGDGLVDFMNALQKYKADIRATGHLRQP